MERKKEKKAMTFQFSRIQNTDVGSPFLLYIFSKYKPFL